MSLRNHLMLAAFLLLVPGHSKAQEDDWMRLHMNDADWEFVEGAWAEDGDGVITAPDDLSDRNLAFHTGRAYADFEAEFDFRWDSSWANAGLVFRARDARHYYLVHFPVAGQTRRAETFWGAISKVSESGFIEILSMDLVPGVTSQTGPWHTVRVAVTGAQIKAWVDGRPMSTVVDATYPEPGYVGLCASNGAGPGGKSSFRNLRIRGQSVRAPAWNAAIQPRRNWFQLRAAKMGTQCGNIMRAPNGSLLAQSGASLLHSTDNGRHWSELCTLPMTLKASGLLTASLDGRVAMHILKPSPPFQILMATSGDNGETWSGPAQTGAVVFPPDKPFTELWSDRLLRLRDGSLLLFAYARTAAKHTILDGVRHTVHDLPGYAGICMRSTDDGASWSGPMDLDGPPRDDLLWMNPKDLRNEIAAAETKSGTVVTLARPHYAPNLWESRSQDGGRTWTPTTRGAFTMYGRPTMLCTESGALLICGRFPDIAAYVSHDEGMTWKGYMIDNAIWANGAAFEVEPDIVLYLYGGPDNPRQLRGQFLQITSAGLDSIPPPEPDPASIYERREAVYTGDTKLVYPKQLPWRRLFTAKHWVEEVRDGALYFADNGTAAGDLINLCYPWNTAPEDETVAEVCVKVESASEPLSVCVRVANGRAAEFLTLGTDRIGLRNAGLSYPMTTTDDFHNYRIVMRGEDIRVYVDGELQLDGTGALTHSADSPANWIEFTEASTRSWNRCSFMLGSASGTGTGAAYWKQVKLRVHQPQ